MSKKGAIIYISSCREKPEFEKKIKEDMYAKSNGLMIFEVLQYPKGMSKSSGPVPRYQEYIGNVGTSGFNFCRQLQIAIKLAYENGADYVVSCEADCLYSPDYFTFVPSKLDTVYRNTNNYVLPYKQDCWYEKDSQTAFQVAGTKFLLDRLNFLLKDQPQWNTEMKNFPKEIGQPFLKEWDTFKTKYACFGIKTDEGMRRQTRHGKEPITELPYWGSVKNIRNKFGI